MTGTGRTAYGMLPRDLAYGPLQPVHHAVADPVAHPVAARRAAGSPVPHLAAEVAEVPRSHPHPAARRPRRATIVTALVLLAVVVAGWSARGLLAEVQRDFDRRADVTVCEFAKDDRC